MFIARKHNLDLEGTIGHHPGQRLEPLAEQRILRVGKPLQKSLRHLGLKIVAPADGLDILLIEGGAHEQSHAAAIPDQTGDAGRRHRQCSGTEKPGAAVIANAGREGRQIKVVQRVVGRAVIDAERALP